jgi:hypothetical protein
VGKLRLVAFGVISAGHGVARQARPGCGWTRRGWTKPGATRQDVARQARHLAEADPDEIRPGRGKRGARWWKRGVDAHAGK